MTDDASLGSIASIDADKVMKDMSISSSGSLTATGMVSAKEGATLTFRENKWVVWSKALVVLVIAVATVVTAIGTYRFTSKAEETNFENRVSFSFLLEGEWGLTVFLFISFRKSFPRFYFLSISFFLLVKNNPHSLVIMPIRSFRFRSSMPCTSLMSSKPCRFK